MGVTQEPPESNTSDAPGAINRTLFEAALTAYAKRRGLPYTTTEDKLKLLGLKYRIEYHRLCKGIIPRFHRAHEIAEMLELDPLALWPKPSQSQRSQRVAA